jgi:hypothetical protein
MWPPSSGFKSKQERNQQESGNPVSLVEIMGKERVGFQYPFCFYIIPVSVSHIVALCLLRTGLLLGLLFNHEDGGDIFLRNVR